MTPIPAFSQAVLEAVRAGGRLWLFLDYDGTLVPFARTPDEAQPDAPLLDLLARLAARPAFRAAVLSGRPLESLRRWLTVPGLILAGTYGVEVRWPDGRLVYRVAPAQIRPTVEQVQAAWRDLVNGRPGFFLEDKGVAVALHARFAAEADAGRLLAAAQETAASLAPAATFRLLGGHRFLEVAPALAHKGRAVEWLLEQAPLAGAQPVYFGDDDKDEEAFAVVLGSGGLPFVVGPPRGPTRAVERFESPAEARRFLASLAEAADRPGE